MRRRGVAAVRLRAPERGPRRLRLGARPLLAGRRDRRAVPRPRPRGDGAPRPGPQPAGHGPDERGDGAPRRGDGLRDARRGRPARRRRRVLQRHQRVPRALRPPPRPGVDGGAAGLVRRPPRPRPLPRVLPRPPLRADAPAWRLAGRPRRGAARLPAAHRHDASAGGRRRLLSARRDPPAERPFPGAEEAYRLASQAGCNPQPGLALLRLRQGQTEAADAAIRLALQERRDSRARVSVLGAAVEILLREPRRGRGPRRLRRAACSSRSERTRCSCRRSRSRRKARSRSQKARRSPPTCCCAPPQRPGRSSTRRTRSPRCGC